jgi:thioester reductase-like protein
MVPSYFVAMTELPTTLNGKVDRKALKEPVKISSQEKPVMAGMDDTEKKMARVWSRILKAGGIGPESNFFALGGDSLGVIKVQAAVLQYGWTVRTQDFYEQQTLRKICACLSAEDTTQTRASKDAQKLENLRNVPVPNYPHLKPVRLRNILLTGATGYLGAHLLAELSAMPDTRIHCLVRGSDDAACQNYLADVLAFYFGSCPDIHNKVSVLRGDIASRHFGLDEARWSAMLQADTIIHSAAMTDHIGHASDFDSVNVNGTKNVIELAKASGAALLHISTGSVSGTSIPDDAQRMELFSEDNYYIGQNYTDNEYIKSKFLAERAVLEAMAEGLNARIFRVGMLTATMDGRFQLRPEKNAFANRLKAIGRLGRVPIGILGVRAEMTPVDLCARAIVKLSLMTGEIKPIYHVYNTNTLTVGNIIGLMEKCGYRIAVVSDQQFLKDMKQMSRQGRLGLLAGLMEEPASYRQNSRVTITADATERCLAELAFEWPQIDAAYMNRFMSAIDVNDAEGRIGEQ